MGRVPLGSRFPLGPGPTWVPGSHLGRVPLGSLGSHLGRVPLGSLGPTWALGLFRIPRGLFRIASGLLNHQKRHKNDIHLKQNIIFQKNDPPEATPPTKGELSITPWPMSITPWPMSITPWPIIDYPVTYYRLPRGLKRQFPNNYLFICYPLLFF